MKSARTSIRRFFAVLAAFGMVAAYTTFGEHAKAVHLHRASAPETGPFLLFAFNLFAFIALLAPDILSSRKAEIAAATQASEAASAAARRLALIESEPLVPVKAPAGIILHGGEVCYLQQDAQRFSLHPVRGRNGSYGGLSVPIGHGIRLNTGQMRQRNVQQNTLQSDGRGVVSLTSARLIFNTSTGNATVSLSHIAGLHGFIDGVRIDIENGKPLTFVTGDTQLVIMLQKVLNGDVLKAS